MPLPNDATLSLQKYTNPADSSQTEPLQAMMVRMTTETFEALERQDKPRMQIQFGSDSQAIMINGVSYPFQLSKDSSPHEIYLRMAQPNKPNAPLRLFANVTAKLAVQRDISRVREQVRGKTLAAEEQRSERQVIVLDKPILPTKPAPTKKRKEPMANRKVVNVDAPRNLATPLSSLPTRVQSPRPPSLSPTPSNPVLRARLIDIIGHNPHATHKLILEYLGIGMLEEERPMRQEVQAHLREIGTYVKVGNKTGEWRLFPELRSEVSREPPTKEKPRGPTEGKTKTTSRPPDYGVSRDGRVSSLRVDNLKGKERDVDDPGSPGTPTSSKSGATRRPGSGYKAPKTGSLTPDPHNPAIRRPAAADSRDVKREVPSPSLAPAARPVSMHERTPSNTSTSAARIPNKPKDSNGVSAIRKPPSLKYGRPESPAPIASSTSGTKRKKAPPPEFDDYSDHDGPNNLSSQKKRRTDEGPSFTLKAKDRGLEDFKERELSLPKKPVVPHEASPRLAKMKREASPHARDKERLSHASPPRGVRSPLPDRERERDREGGHERDRDRDRENVDRERDRDRDKEREPDRDREDRTASSSSSQRRQRAENGGGAVPQRSSGSAKPRRKSPTYTSSEDERESSTQIAARSGVPPPSFTAPHYSKMDVDVDTALYPLAEPPTTATDTPPPKSLGTSTKSLPRDPDTLQRMYRAKYPKYIQLYWTAKSARDTLEEALDRAQSDTQDSDLDAEADVLTLDELSELKGNLEATSAELHRIKAAYLSHTGMEIDRKVEHDVKQERD